MPYPGLLYPESLLRRQATADPSTSTEDTETLKGRSGSVSVGSSGAYGVLSEASESLWLGRVLILNVISPLLPSCWGFSFALRCGVSFFGGIQYFSVDVLVSGEL